jgi:peptidyl-prolyl cis-trans isomerase C
MILEIDHAAKSAGKASASKEATVVSVNGVVIAREAIAREIQNHPAEQPLAAWRAAAQALVVRELLLQEAARIGVVAQPQTDADGRHETNEEVLLRELIEREIRTPDPDEATCRRYYQQHPARFRSPDIYEAAHILFAARRDDADAFAQARRRAQMCLAELQQHPERFGELAAIHSACPSAKHGGNLGQITSGQTTPEFERALAALQPGSIDASVVPTRYGFHIIRLDRKIEGRQLPFELVAERIAQYLAAAVRHRAGAQYIARLASRAVITGVSLADAEAHRVH